MIYFVDNSKITIFALSIKSADEDNKSFEDY
jgi:hypothetical protein